MLTIPVSILVAAIVMGVVFWGLDTSRQREQGLGDMPFDSTVVQEGRALHVTYCAQCHGSNAEGAPNWQEPNPDGSHLPPPHDTTGHSWHHGDGYLYKTIRDGAGSREIPDLPAVKAYMPAFGDRLNDNQIRAIVTYFKSLWRPDQRRFQAEVSARDPFPPRR